jgi:ParB-like chromosome segregation protein Spo0J
MNNLNIKTELVDINKLVPSVYNPRRLTESQEKHLTESIKRFGLVDPILVNKHPWPSSGWFWCPRPPQIYLRP